MVVYSRPRNADSGDAGNLQHTLRQDEMSEATRFIPNFHQLCEVLAGNV